jgi:hypothetical protein
MNTWRRAFVGAATAWSIGVVMAPVVASGPVSQASSAGYAFALLVYAAGSMICHQRPERSFHLLGAQMPVCARCAGIYAGAAVAAIVAWSGTSESPGGLSAEGLAGGRQSMRSGRFDARARRALLVAALPTAVTVMYEWMTGQAPGNWTRLVSGAPLGAAVAWVLLRVN